MDDDINEINYIQKMLDDECFFMSFYKRNENNELRTLCYLSQMYYLMKLNSNITIMSAYEYTRNIYGCGKNNIIEHLNIMEKDMKKILDKITDEINDDEIVELILLTKFAIIYKGIIEKKYLSIPEAYIKLKSSKFFSENDEEENVKKEIDEETKKYMCAIINELYNMRKIESLD